MFDVMLGARHDHPGIEVANSDTLHCIDNCDWYSHHGPYEWSKQPYTDAWWAEMNDTDWDWLRVREYADKLVEDAKKKPIAAVNNLSAHIRQFVPFWFFQKDANAWKLQGKENMWEEDGHQHSTFYIIVAYRKPEEMIQAEREQLLEQSKQQQEEGTGDGESQCVDGKTEVDPIGVNIIEPSIVFDGEATRPDWENGGELRGIGSWLHYWGIESWIEKHTSKKEVR